MLTIKPITIDYTTTSVDSNLSATAFYDKYGTYYASITPWTTGGVFTLGSLCSYNNKVYQSNFNGNNTGNNPITGNTNLTTGLKYWVELDSLNKFAIFDSVSNTQSKGLSTDQSIYFAFAPPAVFTALAIGNLDADSVKIQIVEPTETSNILYEEEKLTVTRDFSSWYEWVTVPFNSANNIYFESIPAYSEKLLIVTIYREDGAPKAGGIVLGRLYDIGKIQYGVSLPSQDFSVVTTDEFGNTKLVKRNVLSGIDGELVCDARQANTIRDLNKALRGVCTAFIGVEGVDNYYFNSLFMMGVATTFEPSIDYATHFRVKLFVKEI